MKVSNLPKVFSYGRLVRVHRARMEKHLGRRLSIHEVVHHEDENVWNNEISNLRLMDHSSHGKHHKPKKVRICKRCGKEFYRQKKGKSCPVPVFCGVGCQRLWAKENLTKKRFCQYCEEPISKGVTCSSCNPTASKPRLCVGCGIVFFRPSKGKGRPPKFCTSECSHRWHKGRPRKRS